MVTSPSALIFLLILSLVVFPLLLPILGFFFLLFAFIPTSRAEQSIAEAPQADQKHDRDHDNGDGLQILPRVEQISLHVAKHAFSRV